MMGIPGTVQTKGLPISTPTRGQLAGARTGVNTTLRVRLLVSVLLRVIEAFHVCGSVELGQDRGLDGFAGRRRLLRGSN